MHSGNTAYANFTVAESCYVQAVAALSKSDLYIPLPVCFDFLLSWMLKELLSIHAWKHHTHMGASCMLPGQCCTSALAGLQDVCHRLAACSCAAACSMYTRHRNNSTHVYTIFQAKGLSVHVINHLETSLQTWLTRTNTFHLQAGPAPLQVHTLGPDFLVSYQW